MGSKILCICDGLATSSGIIFLIFFVLYKLHCWHIKWCSVYVYHILSVLMLYMKYKCSVLVRVTRCGCYDTVCEIGTEWRHLPVCSNKEYVYSHTQTVIQTPFTLPGIKWRPNDSLGTRLECVLLHQVVPSRLRWLVHSTLVHLSLNVIEVPSS
jgi:hypothetical protein